MQLHKRSITSFLPSQSKYQLSSRSSSIQSFVIVRNFMDSCIVCDQIVRPRQEALLCDGCEWWQHRTCQTGISQLEYHGAVRSGKSIDWRCVGCEGPIMNSTPLLFNNDEQEQSMVCKVFEGPFYC